ncbi:MAG: hypothetical protein R3E45_09325 [Rhodocyclaceae bacterium]
MELPLDPVPKHREPFSTRPALIDKYPTHEDKKAFWRLSSTRRCSSSSRT